MKKRSFTKAVAGVLVGLILQPGPISAAVEFPEDVFFAEIPVVTIASRRAEKVTDAPSVVSVVTAEEIQKFGYRTIWEALQRVPGVEIVRGNLQRVRILMRGTDQPQNQKVLFLLNGVPTEVMTLGSFLSSAQIPAIEQVAAIEVLRGPGSALYGSGGFAGVVNIKTKTAKDMDGGELSVWSGENSSYNTSAQYGKTFGRTGFSVFGHRSEDQGKRMFVPADFQTFTPLPSRTPTGVRDPHDAAGGGVTLSHGGLTVNGLWYETNAPGFLSFNVVQDQARDDTYYKNSLQVIDAKWAIYVTPTLRLTPSVAGAWRSMEVRAKILNDVGFFGYTPDWYGGPHEKSKSANSELYLSWDPVEKQSLSGSVGLFRENVYESYDFATFDPYDPSPLPTPNPGGFATFPESFGDKGVRNNYFATGQYRVTVMDGLDLLAGARYDRFTGETTTIDKISYRALKPRLSAVIKPAGGTVVKLLYNQAYRAPSIFLLTQRNNPNGLGNPDLRPENLETYEVSVSQGIRKLQVSANVYHEKVSERLATPVRTGVAIPVTQNSGTLRNNGFDLEGALYVNAKLLFKANYSYIDAYDATADATVPAVARNKAYLSAEWTLLRWLNLNSEVLWRGPRKSYQSTFQAYNGDYPSYSIVNANLIFSPFDRLSVSVGSRNLFNKGYFDPRESTYYSAAGVPTRGREVFVNSKLKF